MLLSKRSISYRQHTESQNTEEAAFENDDFHLDIPV